MHPLNNSVVIPAAVAKTPRARHVVPRRSPNAHPLHSTRPLHSDAVDLEPLSLLSRLAASVPAPRLHTVRYAGVLASASKLRPRLAPKSAVPPKPTADVPESPRRGAYRPWAELLKRTFGFDVLACPCCSGRMKLLALVTESTSVARYLQGIGEPTDVPKRTPARGPPYWASRVLRRGAGSVEAAE